MRYLATDLGLTFRCLVLIALAAVALAFAAVFAVTALYGAAAVVAFVAGTAWDRTAQCDDCHLPLEEG
ncbi:hypothetical protein ACFQ08_00840 [Streptosporangium algeriense]|uniref:Uncharacterized protein n=1 Tax=Streptosporangium algeriense TaxID=1682748 RepID=A0ABW3DHD3_9ACTN